MVRRRSLRKWLVVVGCLVGVIRPGWILAGGALLVAGSLLHVWSKAYLEQNRALITAGPYRWTRNPFYLANLLIDVGLCSVIGQPLVAALYLPVWAIAYRATIHREERRLSELFPGALERYVAAVPALIPTGRRLPRSEASGHFTLDNPSLAEGAEYARLWGVWLAAALIVACVTVRRLGIELFDDSHSMELGVVMLLPVAWVMKLALAEVFRHPQTALLPFAQAFAARRAITLACVVGLLAISHLFASPGAALLSAASVGWLAVLPGAPWSPRARAAFHGIACLAVIAIGVVMGTLWMASLPLLWVALAALDDLAVARLSSRDEDGRAQSVERGLWSAFPTIALGAPSGLVAIAALRHFA